jgi:hypothetical protein
MEIKMSFGILEFSVISAVLALWVWAVVDLLKRDLCGPELTKWLAIVLIFPIVGFILYYGLGRKNRIL